MTLDEFKTIYPAHTQVSHRSKKSWPTAEEKFKQLNKAGDGKLTLKEFLVRKKNKEDAESAFKAADKGNKGYLTLDEFKTIYPPRHHGHPGHHKDKDNNGGEAPAEKPAGTPADNPAGTPGDKPADKPADSK